MTSRQVIRCPRAISGVLLLAASLATLLSYPRLVEAQDREYVIDKSDPECSNRGPGNETKPWCNLWALHNRKFQPGSTVSIKAGDYIGNEDPDEDYEYHDGVNVYAGGTADAPFTLRAWPGNEGQVRLYSGKRDLNYAYLFWGGHLRIKGLAFVGHVDLPDTTARLYSPRVIRFAVTDGPVSDIRFDSVSVLHFQGADDDGLGCRFLNISPVGQCELTRPAEGWARGIDVTEVSDFVFEDGEITCTDSVGREGLQEIRELGLYMAADGIKSTSNCSNVTIRGNRFGACGHNDLMFTRCDSVVIEHNLFKNELHRSASLSGGTGNTVRYNTFAAWEKTRVELRDGGGNALQFRTSNSKVHHNLFYGGGEPNHQGAINFAALDSFVVQGNEVFNNVALALNSLALNLNDKYREPYNLRNNRIFNNIFIGRDTENGVMRWESATRDQYLSGETFGNEIRNNIFYSLTGDPEILSYSGPRRTELALSEAQFNSLKLARNNLFHDPGLADLNFENPDFHIRHSCVAVNAGLPIDVELDFEGKTITNSGQSPSLGPYITNLVRFGTPIPRSPRYGHRGFPAFTTFRWTEVSGAGNYHLQVATDETFDDLILDAPQLPSNRFLVEEPLPYDSRLYWRVRVSEGEEGQLPGAPTDCAPWTHAQVFEVAVGTGSENEPDIPSTEFVLEESYPNPFSATATIRFALADPVAVNLAVFDALGREVVKLVDWDMAAGQHVVKWSPNGESVVSGLYLVRLQAGDFFAATTILYSR